MKEERRLWFEKNKNLFTKPNWKNIISVLENCDEPTFAKIQTANYKNPTLALILALTLGWFGGDAFYEGKYLKGVIKLATCGGFVIVNIIDILTKKNIINNHNVCQYNIAIGMTTTEEIKKQKKQAIKNFAKSNECKDLNRQIKKSLKDLSNNSYATIGH
mgnify:CR=1 FL=1